MKTVSTFTETVEHKSCTATIYRHKHRENERFEVRYYDLDGSLQRVTFAMFSGAAKFANTVVEELATSPWMRFISAPTTGTGSFRNPAAWSLSRTALSTSVFIFAIC